MTAPPGTARQIQQHGTPGRNRVSGPTDRHGNAVPFSPLTDESLTAWHDIIAGDVAFGVALGHDFVRMSSVFGSGQQVPPSHAAGVAVDLRDARAARSVGNDQVYGSQVIGDVEFGYAGRRWAA